MAEEIKTGENTEENQGTENTEQKTESTANTETKPKTPAKTNTSSKELENKVTGLEEQIRTLTENREADISKAVAKIQHDYNLKKFLDGKNLANNFIYESIENKIKNDIGEDANKYDNLEEIFDKFAKDKDGNYINGLFAETKSGADSQAKIDFSTKINGSEIDEDKFSAALKNGAGLNDKK